MRGEDNLARRLSAFFAAVQGQFQIAPSRDGMSQRLSEFFDAAVGGLHGSICHQIRRTAVNGTRPSLTFDELSPGLARLRSSGTGINPWSVAGLRRDEVRTAAVLASLWQPRLGGETAIEFLEAFLERLRPAIGLPSQDQLRRGYSVRTEHCVSGAASERIDLTIEGVDFLLAIEVKIDAPEGERQLERYGDSVLNWEQARGKSAGLVFLAPYAPSNGFAGIPARWAGLLPVWWTPR